MSATVCLIVWDPGETTAGKAADAEQEVTLVDLMQIADGTELAQLVLNFSRRAAFRLDAAVLFTLPPMAHHVLIQHQVPWLTHSEDRRDFFFSLKGGTFFQFILCCHSPYWVTKAIQLSTMIGTPFFVSCWSPRALPSVPAASVMAECHSAKSVLLKPWM